jgi:hypothetical protein
MNKEEDKRKLINEEKWKKKGNKKEKNKLKGNIRGKRKRILERKTYFSRRTVHSSVSADSRRWPRHCRTQDWTEEGRGSRTPAGSRYRPPQEGHLHHLRAVERSVVSQAVLRSQVPASRMAVQNLPTRSDESLASFRWFLDSAAEL